MLDLIAKMATIFYLLFLFPTVLAQYVHDRNNRIQTVSQIICLENLMQVAS